MKKQYTRKDLDRLLPNKRFIISKDWGYLRPPFCKGSVFILINPSDLDELIFTLNNTHNIYIPLEYLFSEITKGNLCLISY